MLLYYRRRRLIANSTQTASAHVSQVLIIVPFVVVLGRARSACAHALTTHSHPLERCGALPARTRSLLHALACLLLLRARTHFTLFTSICVPACRIAPTHTRSQAQTRHARASTILILSARGCAPAYALLHARPHARTYGVISFLLALVSVCARTCPRAHTLFLLAHTTHAPRTSTPISLSVRAQLCVCARSLVRLHPSPIHLFRAFACVLVCTRRHGQTLTL